MTRLVQTTMVRKDIQLSAMRCDVCDAYVFAFCQVPELGRFFTDKWSHLVFWAYERPSIFIILPIPPEMHRSESIVDCGFYISGSSFFLLTI